jgi:4'-phosphopantetheinyl transferase
MNSDTLVTWPVPTEFPPLRPGEIHLWSAWLDETMNGEAVDPADCLSPDERARAEAFHFDADRRRFVAARHHLRHLLARYTGREPAALAFYYGPCGKPGLVPESAAGAAPDGVRGTITFNQSHCDSLWLVAVARDEPVGVDVERVRDVPDFPLLEEQLFTRGEWLRQRALPAPERRLAFFRRWTERESTAKYHGAAFDPARPGIPPRRHEPLSPTPDSVAMLAHGGTSRRFLQFQWNAALQVRPEMAGTRAA